jgi:NTP pyrophosphatase (non-canonical NTP hydrolase)
MARKFALTASGGNHKETSMTLEEYCDFVVSKASARSLRDFESAVGTSGLGIAGEAGEIADLTKKVLFHGMEWNEETRQKMIKELSDVMWYAAFLARVVLNVTIEEVIQANVDKLNARYKAGFTTEEFLAKENAK